MVVTKQGGIALCQDSHFRNNFTSFDARNLPNVNNLSFFKRCDFTIDENYIDWVYTSNGSKLYPSFNNHVFLSSVSGIDFYANSFSTSVFRSPDFHYLGLGIKSINSNFFVRPICAQTPCEESPETNTFAGFEYAIYAVNDLDIKNCDIRYAEFTGNYNGVYCENMLNAHLINNIFNIDATSNSQWAGGRYSNGIYLDACSSYHVEGNKLLGNDNRENNIGIYVKNSGPSTNYIYRNNFNNLFWANIAEGYNYNEILDESGTGLCYKCNFFQDNANDISVVSTEKDLPNGIQSYQGLQSDNDYSQAGNVFSANPEYRLNNRGSDYYIHYIHHTNAIGVFSQLLIPTPQEKVWYKNDVDATFSFNISCRSWIDDIQQEQLLLNEYNENLESENQIIQTINSVKDGGSTEETLLNIETSEFNDAFILRDQLLDISPYLSDTILVTVAGEETVLNNAIVRDILSANPHAGKSVKVLDKLSTRFLPFSEEMYNEILLAANNPDPYEDLRRNHARFNHIRYDKFNKLIELYLDDSTSSSTQKITDLVNADNSLYAELILIKYLLSKKMFDLALLRCEQLSNRLQEVKNISNIQDQLSNLITVCSNLDLSSSNQTQNLEILTEIEATSFYPIDKWAKKIIDLIQNSTLNESYVIPTPGDLQNNKLTNLKTSLQGEFTIFPNPASDYTIVSYCLSEKSVINYLKIKDITGRELQVIPVHYCNQQTVRINNLSNGIYIIELISDGNVISSSKLQIIN